MVMHDLYTHVDSEQVCKVYNHRRPGCNIHHESNYCKVRHWILIMVADVDGTYEGESYNSYRHSFPRTTTNGT